LVSEVIGYAGDIAFDTSRPDGTPQKAPRCEPAEKLGWTARTELRAVLATSGNINGERSVALRG